MKQDSNEKAKLLSKKFYYKIRHKCHQTLTKFTARGEKSHA